MKLYTSHRAPNPRRVRWVMAEKGIENVDFVEIDLLAGEHRTPAYRAKFGVPHVPVLELDDGTCISETVAICRYFEETHPEPPLLGRDPAERAEARRLLQWFDRKFDYEVGGFILHEKMEKRLLGLGAPDLASLRQGREALRVHLAYVESLLSSRDWLVGRRLSLADFAAAAHLSVIDYFGDVPWRDFPAVKTWYMKLKSRPCFRPLLADRWPGLAPAPHYDDLDF